MVDASSPPLYVQVLLSAAGNGDDDRDDADGREQHSGDADTTLVSVRFALLDPYNHLQAATYTKALLEVCVCDVRRWGSCDRFCLLLCVRTHVVVVVINADFGDCLYIYIYIYIEHARTSGRFGCHLCASSPRSVASCKPSLRAVYRTTWKEREQHKMYVRVCVVGTDHCKLTTIHACVWPRTCSFSFVACHRNEGVSSGGLSSRGRLRTMCAASSPRIRTTNKSRRTCRELRYPGTCRMRRASDAPQAA